MAMMTMLKLNKIFVGLIILDELLIAQSLFLLGSETIHSNV